MLKGFFNHSRLSFDDIGHTYPVLSSSSRFRGELPPVLAVQPLTGFHEYYGGSDCSSAHQVQATLAFLASTGALTSLPLDTLRSPAGRSSRPGTDASHLPYREASFYPCNLAIG